MQLGKWVLKMLSKWLGFDNVTICQNAIHMQHHRG